MAFISIVIAIVIAWICLSYFNSLSGKELLITDLLQPKYVVALLALPVVVGLLAGLYPAFYLSSFNPIVVLKGKLSGGVKKSGLRNVLVVAQFAISIMLIVGTIVVYRQLNFIQTTKLGFNKDQILVVNGTGALGSKTSSFKDEVLRFSGVKAAAFTGFLPVANSSRNDNSYSKDAVMNPKNSWNMQTWTIDQDYIPLLGMEIIKGRNFSKEFGSDSTAVIINEATAKLLGYSDPVGKKLYTYFQDQFSNRLISYNIIGVVKNFHYESLKQNVGPLCFRYGKSDWVTAFKVNAANLPAVMQQIETKWRTMAPSMPFNYEFLDESFDKMYRVEQRTGKLGMGLAIVAILIACLGLFGLATYMAEQRIKEIGVRKVLGASVTNITTMLSKDFIKLVLWSTLLAFPIAWFAMNKWLQDFAYRVNISWWIFALAAVIALIIAVITVSTQAIKAAVANPVKSLRTE